MKQNEYKRIEAIDFTKGFLVIVMVAYHLLNYFYNGSHILYMYLNFVRSAFIFFSGFLCGTIYLRKYLKNPQYVYRRLLIRSFKLIALFFVVNFAMHLLLGKNYSGQELGVNIFINNLYSIFIIGNPQIMAFEILLPIAYVLLICALMFYYFRLKFILLTLLIISFVLVSYKGISLGYNLDNILIGMGGFYTGLIYSDIYDYLKGTVINFTIVTLTLSYFLIAVPLGIELNFFMYYVAINFIVASIYILGNWLNTSKITTRHINLFGQYSLFMYLTQILVLQILYRILSINIQTINTGHFLVFIIVNFCLVLFCYVAETSRKRFRIINNMYRLIFA